MVYHYLSLNRDKETIDAYPLERGVSQSICHKSCSISYVEHFDITLTNGEGGVHLEYDEGFIVWVVR